MIKYVLVVLLVGLLLFGCIGNNTSNQSSGNGTFMNKSNDQIVADNRTGSEQIQHAINLAIADGNYEKNVTYAYHSGVETVDIKLSVQNNTITSVSITGGDTNPMSARINRNFAAALPDLVVGKRLDQINLPRNVAGSSLTSAAFKQYLSELETSN